MKYIEKKSAISTKLFRELKSLSILIEERGEEYGFKYNCSYYNIQVIDAMGTFFIFRQMVVRLVYNVHDNVLHHRSSIPEEVFFWALGRHEKVKNIKGIWGHNASFVYTDLIHIDGDLPSAKAISESLLQLESVYNTMKDDITSYIMD